jgi:N-methylhydantoinase B
MASINEFLEIVSDGEKSTVRCTRCGYELCAAQENHKVHALMQEGPVQDAGPHVNPHHLGGDKFVLRRFYCPNCLAQINTEVALRGEPILWDVELKITN